MPIKPTGLRHLKQPEREEKSKVLRSVHRYPTEGQEISMESSMGNKKKQYKDGELVSRKGSVTLTLEEAFGQKKRGYTLEKKRNEIPMAKHGDKLYATVDLSDDFYKKEGVIPGSSIQMRASDPYLKHKAHEADPERPKKPSYETLQRIRQLLQEMDGVQGLSEQQGEQPSWEETTGMKTWVGKKS